MSPPAQDYENIYESIGNEPPGISGTVTNANSNSNSDSDNIYERIDEGPRFGPRRISSDRNIAAAAGTAPGEPTPGPSGAYGAPRAFGRIDFIGHGIGRIERHLSSSCGSGIDSHYTLDGFHPDVPGRISKVSVQWLLVNKWLPMWIANTGNGRDYRIIDFLLGQRLDYDNIGPGGPGIPGVPVAPGGPGGPTVPGGPVIGPGQPGSPAPNIPPPPAPDLQVNEPDEANLPPNLPSNNN